jgi:diphosphomevalonate decarboxylase
MSHIEKWRAPSNIALVKYWGKYGQQLPANPSISFTLEKAFTETEMRFKEGDEGQMTFRFKGKDKPEFLPKLKVFFERIQSECPWMLRYGFAIDSFNSFPHSSGIASSASSMAALALCICGFEAKHEGRSIDLVKASRIARLGSGSACRSVRGGFNLWGETQDLGASSNEYAVAVPSVHKNFMTLQDTILLVDIGTKEVSSTVGHGLMKDHPYAEARFEQARTNTGFLLQILEKGDFMPLAELMEQEALALHAMMMTSHPHFMLFMPGSIAIIRKVMALRAQGMEISFTVDAGANIHLVYPQAISTEVMDIVKRELVDYCHNGAYLCDNVGLGPVDLTA